MTLEKILNTTEVAAILRISTVSVVRLCARGELPGAKKIAAHWRIPESAIAALFKPTEAPAEDEPDGLSARELDDRRPLAAAPPRKARKAAKAYGTHPSVLDQLKAAR